MHSDDVIRSSDTIIKDVSKCNADVIFYGVEIKAKYFKRVWHIGSLKDINVTGMIIPPHVGILINKSVYKNVGLFRTEYKISGDFDWMLRLLNSSNISFNFSDKIIYVMETGGVSNSGFSSEIKKLIEDVKVLKSHGYTMSFLKVILKKINKNLAIEKTMNF